MGSQSQEVQEHVQDGTQVLQWDRFLDHNYYDKSQSRGEDRTKVRNKDNEGDRGTGRDRDSNQDRGMDIERVLRACKEAVQSNNTSLQFIKDARIY